MSRKSRALKKKKKANVHRIDLFIPIACTGIAVGPIGNFIREYKEQEYDELLGVFISSLIITVIATLMWGYYFFARFPEENRPGVIERKIDEALEKRVINKEGGDAN
jgi:hypothetical protein